MFTRKFWIKATERALKAAAQAALLVIGAEQINAIRGVDWENVLGFALGGLILSYLTSIVSAPIGPDKESPSMVAE